MGGEDFVTEILISNMNPGGGWEDDGYFEYLGWKNLRVVLLTYDVERVRGLFSNICSHM